MCVCYFDSAVCRKHFGARRTREINRKSESQTRKNTTLSILYTHTFLCAKPERERREMFLRLFSKFSSPSNLNSLTNCEKRLGEDKRLCAPHTQRNASRVMHADAGRAAAQCSVWLLLLFCVVQTALPLRIRVLFVVV